MKTISTQDFIQDIVNNYNDWTRSDLQAYIEARCEITGENADEILQEIDKQLALIGAGI